MWPSPGFRGPAMTRGLDHVTPSSPLRANAMCWSGCASAELCVHTAIREPSGPSKTRKCSLPVSWTPASVTSGTKTTKSGFVMWSCRGIRALRSAGDAMSGGGDVEGCDEPAAAATRRSRTAEGALSCAATAQPPAVTNATSASCIRRLAPAPRSMNVIIRICPRVTLSDRSGRPCPSWRDRHDPRRPRPHIHVLLLRMAIPAHSARSTATHQFPRRDGLTRDSPPGEWFSSRPAGGVLSREDPAGRPYRHVGTPAQKRAYGRGTRYEATS